MEFESMRYIANDAPRARFRAARRGHARELEHLREVRRRLAPLRLAVLRGFGARLRAGRAAVVLIVERPVFEPRHWLALAATSVLHLLYSLTLQTGYRHSDLSVVYPIARGTGPLLSFVGAAMLLGEAPTAQSVAGMLLIVAGILLVAGLVGHHERAPRVGVFYGLTHRRADRGVHAQ